MLELWCTDIGNAYLEVYTAEKLYVIASGEFVALEGHTLIINKVEAAGHYEYIVQYVNDLAIASKNPTAVIDELQIAHGLKLKGTGPIEYHLGCKFLRDMQGVLCMAPKNYIDHMMDTYFRMFGTRPKQAYTSPLE